MLPFEKCPVCGNNMVSKEVEKLLKGGNNTAIVRVNAEVCQHCGERLYSKETVIYFEKIRKKLLNQDVSTFKALGQTFEVVNQL